MEGNVLPPVKDDMIGRHFSNVIMHWRIRDISLALCSPSTLVPSPEFTLTGPLTTRWKMTLDISCANNIAVLHLDMLPSTVQNLRVQIHWTAYIMNPSDKRVSYVAERKHTFQTNFRMSVEMFKLIDMIKQFSRVLPNQLNMRCSMLVKFGYSPPFPIVDNPGIMALSYDLSRLPKENLHSDVIIKSSNVQFPVHRGMLYHRSSYLASLIRPEVKKTINARLLDHNALEALFSYLYTGDLSFVLSNPSVRICDYIKRLGIHELQDVYPLEKLKLESDIGMKEYQFEWIIYDFSNVEYPISSTELHAENMEWCWQFHLYHLEDRSDNNQIVEAICVEAELLQSIEPLKVCLELCNYNSEGKTVFSSRVYSRVAVKNRLGIWFHLPQHRDMVNCSIGVLFLRFKIRIATGETVVLVKESHPPSPLTINNERTYTIFSQMMGMLQLSEVYSDVTILVGGEMFNAHRFLLAARSVRLKRLLQGSENQRSRMTLSIPKLKSYTFRVFLDFLYTGNLMDTKPNLLLELYDISDIFGVPSLKRVCIDKLVSYVRPDNVLRYLTWSDYKNEKEVKFRAMQYIAEAKYDIIKHDEWPKFVSLMPKLSSFILRCLRQFHNMTEQQHTSGSSSNSRSFSTV